MNAIKQSTPISPEILTAKHITVGRFEICAVYHEGFRWVHVDNLIIAFGLDLAPQRNIIRSKPKLMRRVRCIRSRVGNSLSTKDNAADHWYLREDAVVAYIDEIPAGALSATLRDAVDEFQEQLLIKKSEWVLQPQSDTTTNAIAIGQSDPSLVKILEILTTQVGEHLPAKIEYEVNNLREEVQGEVNNLRDDVEHIKNNIGTALGWHTVLGYIKANALLIDPMLHAPIGTECTKICKERGIVKRKMDHPHWPDGVGMYPDPVIQQAIERVVYKHR